MSRLKVFPDAASLYAAAAEEVLARALDSIRQHDRFTFMLAGGSTPQGLYSLLAHDFHERFPWAKTHFFWGDERHVRPDHPESNYKMAWDAMLSRVAVPQENIHRIETEGGDPQQIAHKYSALLRDFFGVLEGEFPRLDLVLLGLGTDGHTASLFPATSALHETRQLMVANWVQKLNSVRFTMTVPLLNQAAYIVFMVQGQEKAPVLQAVLEGEIHSEGLPAQLIRPVHGHLLWLADEQAASLCQFR